MKDFLEKNLNDAPILGAFVNQSEEIKVEGFELIKVEERDGKQAVNARGLHQFLCIGKDFSSWIKKQIERCDLVENQDFEVFTQKGENLFGGRPTSEYALSVDAAKELYRNGEASKNAECSIFARFHQSGYSSKSLG